MKIYCGEIYNKQVYDSLEREACIFLDVAFNMGGSEAVLESYYSVMTNEYPNIRRRAAQ